MARGESLAPGFRFHPTDEELVRYYLKRKVTNKPFRFDPISFIDIYKSEPWDLPGKSKLKSRDLEWYFFGVLDKKYGNGAKTNRATEKGYWKTTGKDRAVRWNSRTVGMKKTLVYHLGRAPHGERTNWVMHEYRLEDEELEKAGVAQDAFVLCRIFKKSGSGAKNGEQYGAPFVEEDWDNDEEVPVLPGALLSSAEEVTVPHEEFAETTDLDQASIRQNFDVLTSENATSINFSDDGTSYFAEHSADFINTGLKSLVDGVITGNPADFSDDTDLLPGQHAMASQSVKDVFGEQSSNNVDTADFDYSFDPCFVDNSHTEDFFGSNNGNLNLVEPDPLVDSTGFDLVEDYLSFFDAEDDNLVFDPSELFGSENAANDQGPSFKKDFTGESVEEPITDSKKSEMLANHDASSSNKKPEPVEFEPDTKPSFIKQMLGGIPASPAFASDFPMKGSNLQINPGQSSTSIHITAGILRIESRPFAGDSMERPFGNSRDLNITLSFGSSQVNPTCPSSMPVTSFFSGKAGSLISLDCLFFISLWILLLSVSHKVGVHVCHIVISVQ